MADPLPKGTRGVLYARISTDGQDLASQINNAQRWLDARGLHVLDTITDIGSRDTSWKRPGWQKLVRLIEEGKIDWVIADALDRVGVADAAEGGKVVCFFRENGVQLWTCAEGEITSGDALTAIMNVISSLRSTDEQQARGERSVRGKIEQARAGTFLGGLPPLGFDVGCFDPDGTLRWTVYWERADRRWQHFTDGRPPVLFQGKNAFPGRDSGQVLRLVHSRDPKRIEAVKLAFRYYTREALSFKAIARRLNELGYRPVSSELYYGALLQLLLRNPVYLTGVQTWNKKGGGRFVEFVGGEYRDVPRVKGRAAGSRPRQPSDLVTADVPGQGLVDAETFALAQAKLALPVPVKAPRTDQGYLSGLLVCSRCGKYLNAWKQKGLSYVCPTYRKFGKHNVHGCRLYKVQHHRIEALVNEWLESSGRVLDLLLDEDNQLLDTLRAVQFGVVRDYLSTRAGMEAFVRARGIDTHLEVDGVSYEIADLRKEYRREFDLARQETLAKIAQREEDLEGMVRAFVALKTPKAQAMANAQMEALEAEIAALQESLVPLDDRAGDLLQELRRARGRIREALEAMAGKAPRQRAEALRKVLARVVLSYRHEFRGGQDCSFLESARFEPLVGESEEVRCGTSPRPTFVANLLRCTLLAAS